MINFTIITPSIGRKSLERCCESVDRQEYKQWHHFVIFDDANPQFSRFRHIRRRSWCDKGPIDCWGSWQRHQAWPHMFSHRDGYIIYLDDDNYLEDETALSRVAEALYRTDYPDVAIFPILREGEFFSASPIELGRTDASQIIHKPRVGPFYAQHPIVCDYKADGYFLKILEIFTKPVAMTTDPIIVYPKASMGKME